MDDPENEPKTLTSTMLHAMDRQAIAAAIELGLTRMGNKPFVLVDSAACRV
ncbi:hypothetical protein HY948_02040 [Candidatus Gottesmanbacteria bacterium]|nr:hypothetical protein [Candidatus Gottesmanbacteria bacterium]